MVDFTVLLETESDKPIYKDIYESIRSSILSGKLTPGSKLPSSRELARQSGVSRMTVVNAYEQLLAEGYLIGKHGSGTYVAESLPEEYVQAKKPASKIFAKSNRGIELSRHGKYLQKASEAILKNDAETVAVPFQHGQPAADAFPLNTWQKLTSRVAQIPMHRLAKQTSAFGYAPLCVAVSNYLRTSRAVECEPRQVMITAGAQQSLDLISRVLLDRGDKVWMEDPGYIGARSAFLGAGAIVQRCGRDGEGFDLRSAVKKYGNAKLLYTTPSHQFPLGGSTSIGRRLELLDWAEKQNAWIVEDDYDSEFRYQGRPLASMQGLNSSNVIYLGTFSKTMFSALRLGCMIVPADMIDIFSTARLISDGHSPLIEQATLATFIEDGHFSRHVRRMRKLYAQRQQQFLELAAKYLGNSVECAPQRSGMHLVGYLSEGVSDVAASEAAREVGVRVAPLSEYAMKTPKRGGLLFGYAGYDAKEMEEALKKLAKVLR